MLFFFWDIYLELAAVDCRVVPNYLSIWNHVWTPVQNFKIRVKWVCTHNTRLIYLKKKKTKLIILLILLCVLYQIMQQKQNSDQQKNPQDLAQPQEYLHKWFTTEEISLRVAAVRRSFVDYVGSLYADYHPFFRQGAGERYCWADGQRTLGNLLFPSPPPLLRNQAGPGLRRTEPHSALLIDKTPWKKRTANYRPDLRLYVRCSPCELDFGTYHG